MMNFYIIINITFCFNTYFSGSKSSKLTNLEGVAHNVLLIFNSITLSILYLINYFVLELFHKMHRSKKYLYKLADI